MDESGLLVFNTFWKGRKGWMVRAARHGLPENLSYFWSHTELVRLFPTRARAADAVRMTLMQYPFVVYRPKTVWLKLATGHYRSRDGKWRLLRSEMSDQLSPIIHPLSSEQYRALPLCLQISLNGSHQPSTLRQMGIMVDQINREISKLT